jgi:hypothetical protein
VKPGDKARQKFLYCTIPLTITLRPWRTPSPKVRPKQPLPSTSSGSPELVPLEVATANEPAIFGNTSGRAQNAGAVRTGERPLPDDNHRVLGIAQHLGPGMVARGQCILSTVPSLPGISTGPSPPRSEIPRPEPRQPPRPSPPDEENWLALGSSH